MKRKFTNFKTLIILTLLVLGGTSAMAQPLFFADFENGMPSGFTLIDGDGDGNNFEISNTAGIGGSRAMISRSWTLAGGPRNPNDYAFLPKLDMRSYNPGTKVFLSYYVKNLNEGYKDSYTLYVSTDTSGVDTNSLIELQPLSTPSAQVWERVEIDLSWAVENRDSNIFIAFRHHASEDKDYIIFDNIRVGEAVQYDASLFESSISNPYAYTPIDLVSDVFFVAKITNVGTKKIAEATITGKASASTSTTVRTDINPSDTLTVRDVLPITFAPLGELTADFTISITENDEELGNNSFSDVFVTEVTDYFYSRIDTFIPNNMTPFPAVNGRFSLYQYYFADVMSEFPSLINDANSGKNMITNLYGNVYDFSKERNIKKVYTYLAPSSTGQKIWIEIYNYENATNTVGDTIKPIYVSETLEIPSSFSATEVNEFIFELPENGVYLNKGKYIVCVGEVDNTPTNSIGMLGNISGGFFPEWYVPSTSFLNSKVEGEEDINNVWRELALLFGTPPNANRSNMFWNISLETGEPTSVNELELASFVNVFPNPTTGQVTISIENEEFKAQSITLVDIAGRNVHTLDNVFGKRNINLDLENLDKGVYFIKIQSESKLVTKKVILN